MLPTEKLYFREETQRVLFETDGMWKAANRLDRVGLARFALQPETTKNYGQRGVMERGGEGILYFLISLSSPAPILYMSAVADQANQTGETILHVATLFGAWYHNEDAVKMKLRCKKHVECVTWILDTFPELLDETFSREAYKGESALHLAVVNSKDGDLDDGSTAILDLLLERKAKSYGVKFQGSDFCFIEPVTPFKTAREENSNSDEHHFGCTILQFAVASGNHKIAHRLVRNLKVQALADFLSVILPYNSSWLPEYIFHLQVGKNKTNHAAKADMEIIDVVDDDAMAQNQIYHLKDAFLSIHLSPFDYTFPGMLDKKWELDDIKSKCGKDGICTKLQRNSGRPNVFYHRLAQIILDKVVNTGYSNILDGLTEQLDKQIFSYLPEEQKATLIQSLPAGLQEAVKKVIQQWDRDIVDILTEKDYLGNTVLHIAARRNTVDTSLLKYLIKEYDSSCTSAGLKKGSLVLIQNKANLTAFQKGLFLDNKKMIEVCKDFHWQFSDTSKFRVNIDQIDPILYRLNKEHEGNNLHLSAIEIAVKYDKKSIMDDPVIDTLIRYKWMLYARSIFLCRLVSTFALVVCFTVALALQPDDMVSRRKYSFNSHKSDMLRILFEAGTASGTLIMVAFEIREIVMQHFDYFTWQPLENFMQLLFSTGIFIITGVRIFGKDDTLALDVENVAFSVSSVVGWIHLLSFGKGFESVGPLLLVFWRIVTHDFLQWLCLFFTITAGFTSPFFLLLNRQGQEEFDNHGNGSFVDWRNWAGSMEWVIRFNFGQSAFDDFDKASSPWIAQLLFFVYQIFVVILLLNILIAKLVDTFTDVARDEKREWKLQLASLITNIDSHLSIGMCEHLQQRLGSQRGSTFDEGKGVLMTMRKVEKNGKAVEELAQLAVGNGKPIYPRHLNYWNVTNLYDWMIPTGLKHNSSSRNQVGSLDSVKLQSKDQYGVV